MLKNLLAATGYYSIWDWGCLKMALVSLGILFGLYFRSFFLEYTTLIWIVFLFCYISIGYRTLKLFKQILSNKR